MHHVPVSAIPTIERDIVASMTREFASSDSTCAKCSLTPPTSSPTSNLQRALPTGSARPQQGGPQAVAHHRRGPAGHDRLAPALAASRQPPRPADVSKSRRRPGPTLPGDRRRDRTVTLVFDKGNNSRENLDWVERSPFHFIGSLVPTQHPHLLDVSVDQMRSLEADGLAGICAYRTECKVFGVQRTLLGKTLLFTDQAGWSDAELVRRYRAQHHVESAFRQLKNSDCIAIRPQYHWTDQKIAVHVFCCVLALMPCGLLQRELSRHGMPGSIPALLDELRGIREVDVLYPARETDGEPELRTTLSRMTDEQRTMYDILGLENLAI